MIVSVTFCNVNKKDCKALLCTPDQNIISEMEALKFCSGINAVGVVNPHAVHF